MPDEWSSDEKGSFYEHFVSELLQPLRLEVVERLRVTGMEIDLLAKGKDDTRTILVECKAHRDPLPADSLTKLLGNVGLRKADAGWLFTTSSLTKDGRGTWEDIKADPDLSSRIVWYSPQRTIDLLIDQRSVIDPKELAGRLPGWQALDWTLLITPRRRAWLGQLVEQGLPTRFVVYDANSGAPLDAGSAQEVGNLNPRFSSLQLLDVSQESPTADRPRARAPVAKVSSGDSWDDPRPARPLDFVGRDDILGDVAGFIADARRSRTTTRTFAVQGPSGWGKSSLTLKLAHMARTNRLPSCSLTAVDSRSATNSAFVSEALRQAFLDARDRGFLPKSEFKIQSLRDPLESIDLQDALRVLQQAETCIVLIFDQFEELFAKEVLFETFNAVRELSLDIDSLQAPLILGFAWKTDIALPQQHPAYHLWHQLGDRRRTFKLREFGRGDIARIIGRAERSSGRRLTTPLRARLVEQCQGLPWLLKKLLVHVLQRVKEAESQYLLLERELDVELLFKEDLALLKEEQVRCLKYVAARAPVAVTEIEENFQRDVTNLLINSHLLVRSGMNYVVYWDIFRDYLVEGKVPHIPWARTFQRGPAIALKALQRISDLGAVTVARLALAMGLKEGTCFNLLADLVALQLVDAVAPNSYQVAAHLTDTRPMTIARHVQGQLRRHVVVKVLSSQWEPGRLASNDAWWELFASAQSGASGYSIATSHSYANNLRRWLLFAGIVEQQRRWLRRPIASGAQMGVLESMQRVTGTFLGSGTPAGLKRLLESLLNSNGTAERAHLEKNGHRNAVSDALALGLINRIGSSVELRPSLSSIDKALAAAKEAVVFQPTVRALADGMSEGIFDAEQLGRRVEQVAGGSWMPTSAKRYANGLKQYIEWADESLGRAAG
jgi:hypothetical protein